MAKIDSKVRKFIHQRDEYKCSLCDCPETKKNRLQIHHIKYRCRGGTNDPSNLMLVCQECHTAIHKGVYNGRKD